MLFLSGHKLLLASHFYLNFFYVFLFVSHDKSSNSCNFFFKKKTTQRFSVRDFVVVKHVDREDDEYEEKGLEPDKSVFPPFYSLFDPLLISPICSFEMKPTSNGF